MNCSALWLLCVFLDVSKSLITIKFVIRWKQKLVMVPTLLSLAPYTTTSGATVNDKVVIVYNPLRPSDAYMRQWTRPSLIQIMACRLTGAKPLSEPMPEYCLLDPWEQTSVKFKKMHLDLLSAKWQPFCLGLNVLMYEGNFAYWDVFYTL